MEVIVFICVVCLIVIFMCFINDENTEQSELHSKTRYRITEELEKMITIRNVGCDRMINQIAKLLL